ncbi:MAG: SRPBCC family protein [Halobacteriales archaeon]
MTTYSRRTRVAAPLSAVWAFHSTVDGLVALTPGFMNLRVEGTEGPDGAPDPDELVAGSRVHVSVRAFGVGPRQTWTSYIRERERGETDAYFRDVMEDGPFQRWDHVHRFVSDGEATVVEDRLTYALPGGPVGRAISPLGWVGMEPMFRYRHRKTRELLE